jgi:hypothetical protein
MNTVYITSEKYPVCKASITVMPYTTDGDLSQPALVVDTGCARLQTYPTRRELLALADMLRAYVDKMEVVPA